MFISTLALLLPTVVSALPFDLHNATFIPFDGPDYKDTRRSAGLTERETGVLLRSAEILGFHHDTNTIHAFKRDEYLGAYPADVATRHLNVNKRQDGGTCSPLNTNQVQSIAGWKKFDDTWRYTFGDGEHYVHTNPQEEPDNRSNPPKKWDLPPDTRAERCLGSDPIGTIEFQGDPTCNKQTTQIQGSSTGTNATSTITNSIGTTVSMTHSVTNEEKVGIKMDFEAGFSIPVIGEGKVTAGFSFDYTHSDNKAKTNTQQSTTTQSLAVPNPDGKTCYANLDTDTCTAKAKGQIKSYVRGYVWYSYKDKAVPNQDFAKKAGLNLADEKHWSWSILLESVLSLDERMIATPFTSDIGSTTTKAMYGATCS